jgi:prepilin peptidase CpaA
VLLTGWTSLLLSILPVVCLGLILAASLHDIVARTIPNGLPLALALAGIVVGALHGYLLGSLLAAGAVFVLSAVCWRRGWMGGGDVKLLGAAALGMPPGSVPTFVAAVAIAGGLLALVYLAARHFVSAPVAPRPDRLFARAMRVERWRIGRGGPLPYACAIAAGFLFVIVSGPTP